MLANLLWSMMLLIYKSRKLKSLAEAMVGALFDVLAEENPQLFEEPLMNACSWYIRKKKIRAWKVQKTIDAHATGGLN